jgi:hypothetical protein
VASARRSRASMMLGMRWSGGRGRVTLDRELGIGRIGVPADEVINVIIEFTLQKSR